MNLRNYRENFPVLSEKVYLDSAGAGIPPLSVTNAMLEFIKEWSREGEKWEEWLKELIEVRSRFASLIDVDANQVAVVPSVSVGLASFASSLDLTNKKVVTSELNFPTNILLWQRMREKGLVRKVEVLRAKDGMIPRSSWKNSVDKETALVAVDYVSWLTGWREDLKELADIAHKKGALILVDGFHATGVFPFSVRKLGLDVFVTGFYKWMCGPHGVACLYVSKELLEKTEPSYLGWHGVRDNVAERVMAGRDPFDKPFPTGNAEPSHNASRYEWGTWAAVVIRGVLESLKWCEKVSPSKRYKTISRLREILFEKIENAGFNIVTPETVEEGLSGIVTFKVKDHVQTVEKLRRKGIIVSGRFNHIRVSPHFYNTEDDILSFSKSLKD